MNEITPDFQQAIAKDMEEFTRRMEALPAPSKEEAHQVLSAMMQEGFLTILGPDHQERLKQALMGRWAQKKGVLEKPVRPKMSLSNKTVHLATGELKLVLDGGKFYDFAPGQVTTAQDLYIAVQSHGLSSESPLAQHLRSHGFSERLNMMDSVGADIHRVGNYMVLVFRDAETAKFLGESLQGMQPEDNRSVWGPPDSDETGLEMALQVVRQRRGES